MPAAIAPTGFVAFVGGFVFSLECSFVLRQFQIVPLVFFVFTGGSVER